MSIIYYWLGRTNMNLGKIDKSLMFFLKEVKLKKELFDTDPNNYVFKNRLAISYSSLGWFYVRKLRNNIKAKEYYTLAKELFKELVINYPNTTNYRKRLELMKQILIKL